MLLFACREGANAPSLLRLADDLGLGKAEGLALGELLLDRLTLADLLGHDSEHLNLTAIAGEQGWLSLMITVDPLDGTDTLANLMRC